ncbi:MAG TPA: XrtA/PEP-CTERM system TPR-repeat protein PrsT [Rhodocyclaceae bacterium]|nr:XrtA/PEP-CTERM system TPR-repeat protein PrsT [Rhodocyclaceae bacterium]
MRITLPTFPLTAAALAVSIAIAGCGGDSPDKLVSAAKLYLEKNDPAAATIQLKNALAKNPDLAEARFLLGKALLESGDASNAEVELRKAVDLKYSADEVAVLMARSLVARGQYKKVIDDYAQVSPATPLLKAELKTQVATAQLALGKVDEATATYAQAVAAQPDYAPALLGQARIKAGTHDLPGAMAIIDGVLAKDAKNTDALIFKAGVQMASDQGDAALQTYNQVLSIKPDHVLAHTSLIMSYMQQNKLDLAQKQLDAMKQALPKSGQTTYMQGLLAYQQKNMVLAKESAQALLKGAPNDPRALQLAGAVEFENRSDLQAQEYLSQALARAPGMEMGRRLLVRSYMRTGQTSKAIAALQPALQEQPTSAGMLSLAGEVYMQAGDAAKAEGYFAQASKLDPQNAKNRTAMAMIHVARGDASKGVGELEQIAASDSGTTADMALIAASMSQKRFDQALQAIAALQKKQPDNLVVYNLRAAALHEKGDAAGARKSLEQAVSINPAYYPAAAALARLDLLDKKPEDAAKRFDTVLAKDPKNVQALLSLAELRSRAGAKSDEVVDLIKKAIAASPSEPTPRVALVSYYLSQKDNAKAVTAAQEGMSAVPDRPEVLDIAGRAMQQSGDFNQAISIYTKLASLLPNSDQPYLRLAEVQYAAKNKDAARESVNKGLQAQPDSLPLLRVAISMDMEAQRFGDAANRAKAIQKNHPKDGIGYLLEGDVLAAQKSWVAAVAAYRNGLKAAESTDLATHLHAVLTASGQEAEANRLTESWLKAHPKDLSFRMFLAGAAVAHKNYAAAVTQYRRVLEDQPNNPAVMNDLAWSLGKLGDPKAMGFAEQANKLAPNQPAMMDTLGVLQVQQGQLDKGTDLLRRAVELAPQAAAIRLNYARALLQGGKKAAAKTELETLAKLGDAFAEQAEVASLLKSL